MAPPGAGTRSRHLSCAASCILWTSYMITAAGGWRRRLPRSPRGARGAVSCQCLLAGRVRCRFPASARSAAQQHCIARCAAESAGDGPLLARPGLHRSLAGECHWQLLFAMLRSALPAPLASERQRHAAPLLGCLRQSCCAWRLQPGYSPPRRCRLHGGICERSRPASSAALLIPTLQTCHPATPALPWRPQIESGGVTHEHTRKWLYLQELQAGRIVKFSASMHVCVQLPPSCAASWPRPAGPRRGASAPPAARLIIHYSSPLQDRTETPFYRLLRRIPVMISAIH